MKNQLESMPNPAEERKNPIQSDEDIESLMKAFEETDKEKEVTKPEARKGGSEEIGSMLEESLGELEREQAAKEKEGKELASTNLHERVARSAAKVAEDILHERLGEAMVQTANPGIKAYSFFKTAVEAMRTDVKAPAIEGSGKAKEVAVLVDDFIRQEARSALRAALRQELDKSTVEWERVRLQELMDAIERAAT